MGNKIKKLLENEVLGKSEKVLEGLKYPTTPVHLDMPYSKTMDVRHEPRV